MPLANNHLRNMGSRIEVNLRRFEIASILIGLIEPAVPCVPLHCIRRQQRDQTFSTIKSTELVFHLKW